MGILIGLMFLGLVIWLSWQVLKNDVRKEGVSRDVADAVNLENCRRVQRNLQVKVDEWRRQEGK